MQKQRISLFRLIACIALVMVSLSACSSSEESARKLYNKGMALQKQGENDEALKVYESIVEKYPETQTAVEVNKVLLLVANTKPPTENQLEAIKMLFQTGLDAFRLDNGRYPSVEEGLEALFENPGINTWDGPYLSSKFKPQTSYVIYGGPSGLDCSLTLR